MSWSVLCLYSHNSVYSYIMWCITHYMSKKGVGKIYSLYHNIIKYCYPDSMYCPLPSPPLHQMHPPPVPHIPTRRSKPHLYRRNYMYIVHPRNVISGWVLTCGSAHSCWSSSVVLSGDCARQTGSSSIILMESARLGSGKHQFNKWLVWLSPCLNLWLSI